ncbi:AAA family ATPase [Staphylococcus epidermidis]|uniref:AAA family ATPase n=1 Tax=Staphylococcus epidermidis TaxID=1282 RepID=UPI0030BC2A79|nr:AAA family ATPase [Staphylococcus epidermidis]
MTNLEINLSLQENKVFDTEASELQLLNKNFIFGKNGSGKSSLTKLIKKNYSNEFDVRIFSGFEGVLINEKLNAIVLGEENEENSKKIEKIKDEIEDLDNRIYKINNKLESLKDTSEINVIGKTEHHLLKGKKELVRKKEIKDKKLDEFYKDMAKSIKNSYQNYIQDTSYNKNKFMNDLLEAKELDKKQLKESKEILKEKDKEKKLYVKFPVINTEQIIEDTNLILQKSVKESFPIEELSGNDKKKEFAKKGMELHDINDNCSFCGNIITKERIDKLNRYFSSKDIELFQEEIDNFKQNKLDLNFSYVEKIEEIKEEEFFNYFTEDIKKVNQKIREKKTLHFEFLNKLQETIKEKKRTLFSSMSPIKIENISNFEEEEQMIRKIVDQHNRYNEELQNKRNDAMKKVRLHYVAIAKNYKEDYKKDWKGYEIEKFELDDITKNLINKEEEIQKEIDSLLGQEKNPSENTLKFLKNKKHELNEEKNDLLSQTKNSSILATRINEKLSRFGKNNLRLELIQDNENIEHYKVQDDYGLRDIQKLSTGERNIIAFLYFMEGLEISDNSKNKIIVLDDPMNSNDDSMQYLIITEIQKLYQGKNKQRFNHQNDYFLCLTHNVHFYLNVQPQGNYKENIKNPNNPDGKLIKRSKYDKYGFYWLENGKFRRILSEKEDINTHYEHLWFELEYLYKNNMLNSMLNSMRRIIETFIHFNKINPDKFYKNYEEHRKLFNVNSHGIDDFTAEIIGKNKEIIFEMFRQIFEANEAKNHYDNYINKWN